MCWGVDSTTVVNTDNASGSRIEALVNAVNESIDDLRNNNPDNRVAIVYFNKIGFQLIGLTTLSDSNLANADSEKINGIPQYLKIDSFSGTQGMDDGEAKILCNIGDEKICVTTDSKTNIQYGLFEGMSILANQEETTFTFNDKTYTRIPNIVLMSDGAPTTISLPEHDGEWWNELDYNDGNSVGWGDNDQAWSANGMMPMLTAQYFKNKITSNYYDHAKDS